MRAVNLVFVFLFYLEVSCALTEYKFVKMECLPEPKYIANATCKLKAINRYRAVANMDCDIVKPLRNISLHMQTFKKDYTNQYKPFLINLTFNVCAALNRNEFFAYNRLVLGILKDTSNVNHSCPYSGHLFTRNLFVDQRYMPVSLPLGTYKAVFRYLEGYPFDLIGTVNFYIEVLEDTKLKKKSNRKSN